MRAAGAFLAGTRPKRRTARFERRTARRDTDKFAVFHGNRRIENETHVRIGLDNAEETGKHHGTVPREHRRKLRHVQASGERIVLLPRTTALAHVTARLAENADIARFDYVHALVLRDIVHGIESPCAGIKFDMPHKHPVIREAAIPFDLLAVFEYIPFLVIYVHVVCKVVRTERRERLHLRIHFKGRVIEPAHEISLERAVVGRLTVVPVIHAGRHHVPRMCSRSLVGAVGIVGAATTHPHAIMILETHRMAEFMD